jgi:hypothetical protein
MHSLRFRDVMISWLNHTPPRKRCVYFAFVIAAASRNTRFTGGPLWPYL